MHTHMFKLIQVGIVAIGLLGAPVAKAFSLIGPYTSWQVQGIGYQLPGDIGGPMGRNEGFRWNVPVIYYGFDQSFIEYFGPDGVRSIDQAFAYFNDLPKFSEMSSNLAEYSTSSIRENYTAASLGIIDIKTTAMSLIMEELGFADPIRFTFTLLTRTTDGGPPPSTNYVTTIYNYDPVTVTPSRYVNGKLYTYEIREFRGPPFDYADAIEIVRDGSSDAPTVPVAGAFSRTLTTASTASFIGGGAFRTGLTRDDVGGLRYLYGKNNYAVETLITNQISGGTSLGSSSAWVPFTSVTNVASATNTVFLVGGGTNIVSVGLRGGRNKLKFQRVFFDNILGQSFTPVTNQFTDVLIGTNRTLVVQALQRVVTTPDFLFVSENLGYVQGLPVFTSRTDTSNWIDNDLLNGNDETGLSHGPGVIAPPVRISFSNQLPYFVNTFEGFIDEDSAASSGVWGSFDGSTNAPIIYPYQGELTLQELRRRVLAGGGNSP
jgi:hypothetical protein